MKKNRQIVGVVLLLCSHYLIASDTLFSQSAQNMYSISSISSAAEKHNSAMIKIDNVPVVGGVEFNPSPDQTKYLSGISALSIVCLTIVACMRPDLIYCLLHGSTETK